MKTETNFIALVPGFKFERRPTFVLACDADGLRWIRYGFLGFLDAKTQHFFVIGDGIPIASDDMCRLTVAKSHNAQASEILPSLLWHIGPSRAATYAAKLSSLLLSNMPGHQYLDVERGNYQTVVITKHEYTVDIIRAMRDSAR
jgi:hypothetical protein